MWFKGVELSKEGIIAPVSALEHKGVVIERICNQATKDKIECACVRAQGIAIERSAYTRVFRVALVAIVNLLVPWDIGAVTCNRAHLLFPESIHFL